jgi:hypothetical protein
MIEVWALPSLQVSYSFNLKDGNDVASAAQADTNIQRASDGAWVIRAGPFHSKHYCCMEEQYYHYA